MSRVLFNVDATLRYMFSGDIGIIWEAAPLVLEFENPGDKSIIPLVL